MTNTFWNYLRIVYDCDRSFSALSASRFGPSNEENRRILVERVWRSGLPSEALLSGYCRSAAAIFGAPIAFMSLVRSDDVQFVGRIGVRLLSTPREVGLCSSAIRSTDCYVVRDARRELRGIPNQLVDGEPGIRFYAAAPLRPEGLPIGTLAVADSSPRTPEDRELHALSELAQLLTAAIQQNLNSASDVIERLRDAKRQEVRSWFAYGLSHEYANAITGSMALEETLQTLLPTTASPLLSKLHSTHLRMANLTRDFIRFHEGVSHSAPQLSLNQLTDAAATLISYVVNEQIELSVDLDASLNAVPIETRGLEFPLALVVVRGRDAMEGRGSLSIATRLVHLTEEKQTDYLDVPGGDYATITVTDHGSPPGILERRALAGSLSPEDATSPDANALWLAQEALRNLGGQIDLDTAEDGSNSITFFVPLLGPVPHRHGRRKFRLLLVEDASILVQALQSALSRAGYDVTVATRAEQALRVVPDLQEIDLLIADVLVPGMNGVDLARQLRASKPDLPVILISGQTDRSHFEPGELEHAAVFLQKPFSMEVLLNAVERLLRPSELRPQ